MLFFSPAPMETRGGVSSADLLLFWFLTTAEGQVDTHRALPGGKIDHPSQSLQGALASTPIPTPEARGRPWGLLPLTSLSYDLRISH